MDKNKINKETKNDTNKTFNKLSKIQKLLKKESSMKKLCKYYLLIINIILFL